MRQPMRNYRRNGTPIGDHRVYVVKTGRRLKVWEVKGYKTWEEVAAGVPVDAMSGAFDFEKDIKIAMPGCYFSKYSLAGINVEVADLRGANFREAFLYCANFRGANLSKASLRKAELSKADLREADLREADLREANVADDFVGHALLEGAYRLPSDPPIPGWRVVDGRLRRR